MLTYLKTIRSEYMVAGTVSCALWAGVIVMAAYLPNVMSEAAIDSAFHDNVESAEQLKLTRGYYTQNVVAKALQTRSLVPQHLHKGDPNAIPLPATFVLDISDLLKKRDTTISLVSPYPWPNRIERKMDDFQANAWSAFQENPAATFSRQEMRDGKRILRVAIADRLTNNACVECHNSHPESPKKDWKLNDVRAVMEVNKVIEPYIANAERRADNLVYALAAAAFFLTIMLFSLARLVSRFQHNRRVALARIRYLAHHDAMTGAFNREWFLSLLSKSAEANGPTGNCAVHYIDLDGFKEINDRFGHGAGDELIKQAYDRIKAAAPKDCYIGRLGGDEFVVTQPHIRNEHTATDCADMIVKSLAQPFQLHHNRVAISTSIGVAIHSGRFKTGAMLLEAADIALYKAKANGRNRYVVFSPGMSEALDARRILENKIRNAAPADIFQLYFQPIVDRDLRLRGFEASLQMPDDNGSFIEQAEFMKLAEETGASAKIWMWALERSCAAAALWPGDLTLTIRLVASLFRRDVSLTAVICEQLEKSGLPAHRLEVKIPDILLDDLTEATLEQLRSLTQAGLSIVLDNFGVTGSHLDNLWKQPLNKIAIAADVSEAHTDRARLASIYQAIIMLAHAQMIDVVAKGVDKQEHADILRDLRCDFLQGALFGEPTPESDLGGVILRDFCAYSGLQKAECSYRQDSLSSRQQPSKKGGGA